MEFSELLLERVSTAPFSGVMDATGADRSRKLMEELSSTAPVSGERTGDVKADN